MAEHSIPEGRTQPARAGLLDLVSSTATALVALLGPIYPIAWLAVRHYLNVHYGVDAAAAAYAVSILPASQLLLTSLGFYLHGPIFLVTLLLLLEPFIVHAAYIVLTHGRASVTKALLLYFSPPLSVAVIWTGGLLWVDPRHTLPLAPVWVATVLSLGSGYLVQLYLEAHLGTAQQKHNPRLFAWQQWWRRIAYRRLIALALLLSYGAALLVGYALAPSIGDVLAPIRIVTADHRQVTGDVLLHGDGYWYVIQRAPRQITAVDDRSAIDVRVG